MFKNAKEFDVSRGAGVYLPGVPGFPPAYPGQSLGRPALVGLLKAVGSLPKLRGAPGPIGKMKTLKAWDGSALYMTRDGTTSHTYPSSMKVNWD